MSGCACADVCVCVWMCMDVCGCACGGMCKCGFQSGSVGTQFPDDFRIFLKNVKTCVYIDFADLLYLYDLSY